MKKAEVYKLMNQQKKNQDISLIDLFCKKSTESEVSGQSSTNIDLLLSTIGAVRFPMKRVKILKDQQCLSSKCKRPEHSEEEMKQMKEKVGSILVNMFKIDQEEATQRVTDSHKPRDRIGVAIEH